jgi:hypothetical protein
MSAGTREPDWQAPIDQYWNETTAALGDCEEIDPNLASIFSVAAIVFRGALRKFDKPLYLAAPIKAGALIVIHPEERRLDHRLRQLFGRQAPKVLPIRTRRGAPPRQRELLKPLLAVLAMDADLRPIRQVKLDEERTRLLAPAIAADAARRMVIGRLPLAQRQHVCGIGYLFLIGALAACAAAHRDMQGRRRVRAVMAELSFASRWLFGRPRKEFVRSVTELLTGESCTFSSVKLVAKGLPSLKL